MTQPVPEMMTLLLEIGEQSSQLWLSQPDAAPSHYPLAFGTHAIQPGPFRNAPPTPLELERAIMVVEDELMRIAPLIPPGLQLTLRSQPSLAEVLGTTSSTGIWWNKPLASWPPWRKGIPWPPACCPATSTLRPCC